MPPDIRGTVTPLPKGPLDSRKSMNLIADIRRSELRNNRQIARARAHYEAVRRAYSK